MERQIVITGDGSHTLYVPQLGDHYHSVHGAIRESRHIFIGYGYRHIDSPTLRILEVGFGTGLNALLTGLEAIAGQRTVYYETWEAFPLSSEEAGLLNYAGQIGEGQLLFESLHQAPWSEITPIAPGFSIKKVRDDIRHFHSESLFDLVYFDAFGPDYQPELWETVVFRAIANAMATGACLVTYSAKGQVRRNLREAGFRVEKAPGPPGKREITRAFKT
jgi:tRNA U34 5-methylaminomethyl-2-thiouridine-forming methyltransferase MnmC